MKNKLTLSLVIIALAITAYFIGTSLTNSPEEISESTKTESVLPEKPERKAEVYGKVIKMEGNLVTIAQIDTSADPTADMTTAEKQAYKQSLSEEERMALNASIQGAVLGEVTVLIPVGIPMTKKTQAGPEAPEIEGTLADIANGSLLSVWIDTDVTDRKVAEFVKISTQTN
jgi:hypothetical protein